MDLPSFDVAVAVGAIIWVPSGIRLRLSWILSISDLNVSTLNKNKLTKPKV